VRIHRFAINELTREDAGPSAQRKWVHWRGFAHCYGAGDRELGQFQLEVVVQPPLPEFSAALSVGTAGSETPFDGHLTIAGTGVYWGTSVGRRLAHQLSQRLLNRCSEHNHQHESRQLRVAVHDGRLWWELWTHSGHWQRDEFANWRAGNARLNPLDLLWGQRRYWYQDVDQAFIVLEMPEGHYEVKATLQRQLCGRPQAKRRDASWVVDIDSTHGVPTHFDHSGGYKGDRTHGFGVGLPRRRRDWHIDAKAAAEAWVLEQRARTGFREAQAAQ
jgi:hypothetical protein